MDRGDWNEKQRAFALDSLAPRRLLLNMAVQRHRTPGYTRLAGKSGLWHPVFGTDCEESEPASAHFFTKFAPEFQRMVEADPDIQERLDALRSMGFNIKWVSGHDYRGMLGWWLAIQHDPAADKRLRDEAKRQAGTVTRKAAENYDEQWQLYFNQNYDDDWRDWREKHPIVEFP